MKTYLEFINEDGTLLHHHTNNIHQILDDGHIKSHSNISDRSYVGRGISTTRDAHYASSAIGGKRFSISLHKSAVKNIRHAKLRKVRDPSYSAEKEAEERIVHKKGRDIKVPLDSKHVHHVTIHYEEPSKNHDHHNKLDREHIELEKRLKEKGIKVHYTHKSGLDHGYHYGPDRTDPKSNRRISKSN